MDFSQRHGLVPVVLDSTDSILSTELRIRLWNVVLSRLFGKIAVNSYGDVTQEYHIFIVLWKVFFKNPMDEYERGLASRKMWYRDVFETLTWNRVFDFFEFVAQRMIKAHAEEWMKDTNEVLSEERAGIAFVGLKLTPISDSHLVKVLLSAQQQTNFSDRNKIELELVKAKEAFSEKSSQKLAESCTRVFDCLRDVVDVKTQQADLSWVDIFRLANIESSSFSAKHFSVLSEQLKEPIFQVENDESSEWILASTASLCAFFLKKFENAGLIDKVALENSVDASVTADLWGERK